MSGNNVSDEWLKASWLLGALAWRMDEVLGGNSSFIDEARLLNAELDALGGVNMQTLELLRDEGRRRGLTEEQMTLSPEELARVEDPMFIEVLRAIHELAERRPDFARVLRKINDEYVASREKGGVQ